MAGRSPAAGYTFPGLENNDRFGTSAGCQNEFSPLIFIETLYIKSNYFSASYETIGLGPVTTQGCGCVDWSA